MPNPNWDDGGGNVVTFRPGSHIVRTIPDSPRQRHLVSSNGTVRVLELSTTDDRFVEVDFIQIPTADEGSFSGRDSLRTFIVTHLNWAENTFTLTDTDGDTLTCRYWSDDFDLREASGQGAKQDTWSGTVLLRVEV